MSIQKEREDFEKFKAKQIGVDYEALKKDLDDCERRFPNNRYAGWNFKSDWELWQSAKSQAVPEGFVLVPKEKIESLVDELHVAFKSNLHLTTGELLPLQQDFQLMIEAQEQSHE